MERKQRMGRHRRSAPHPPAPSPESDSAGRRRRGAPVRTGLLGASAAMAVGAAAMASGLLPGDGYPIGGGDSSGGRVQADDLAVPETRDESSEAPEDRGTAPAELGGGRDRHPSDHASGRAHDTSSGTPAPRRSGAGSGGRDGDGGEARPSRVPDGAPEEKSTPPSGPAASDPEAAAESEVVALVNEERRKAGCSPVTADSELADLAQSFSEDMAGREFFSHTDPDGTTPWDRAEEHGISDLGGENIARGQSGPESVMEAWMASPGHRANILNCDYKTLGVGAHFADGGPWWTQDFGY
nr:CAP domain-containing protein [Streptomyces lycii]